MTMMIVVVVLLSIAGIVRGSDDGFYGGTKIAVADTGGTPENTTTSDAAEGARSGGSDRQEFPAVESEWSHSVYLDDSARVRFYWTPRSDDIVMRLEAPTRGFVGIGFAKHQHATGMAGADLAVGWVRDGEAFLQDRHGLAKGEPKLDKHQDWLLIGGFENETHTSIIVSRRYDTCDRHDVRITNDTMRVIYAFHKDDPVAAKGDGGTPGGRAKYHGRTQRGGKSLLLLQRPVTDGLHNEPGVVQWDLLNPVMMLPKDEDTLNWCKIFKLPNITQKHHLSGYKPIVATGHASYMHHSLVYECRSDGPTDERQYELLLAAQGHMCFQFDLPALLDNCDKIVAAWTKGSAGFAMPPDVGMTVDPDVTKYYKLEIHFDNPSLRRGIIISAGLSLYLTPTLRKMEAGVLTVGINPNWMQIIPPMQKAVLSYGHCVGECTEKAFASTNGISIFAVTLQTHVMGRKWRLRHVTNATEIAPIASDNNYDYNYQENRMLAKPVKILPGDHLITECAYNSRGRDGITVGGQSTREEKCVAFVHYYPRVAITSCLSNPTFDTVYGSMGVEEVYSGSLPPAIKKPEIYANNTLAEHLSNYNWEENIGHYEKVTKYGSFDVTCWVGDRSLLLPNAVFSLDKNMTEFVTNETQRCSRHRNHNDGQTHATTLATATTKHRKSSAADATRPPRKQSSGRRTTTSATTFERRRTNTGTVTSHASRSRDEGSTFRVVTLFSLLLAVTFCRR